MSTERRDQLIDIITREFIGPDPIDYPGLRQENGEEILASDPPHIRYAAGILFPQKDTVSVADQSGDTSVVDDSATEQVEVDENMATSDKERSGGKREYLEDAEELLNLSNAYKQSAISLTVSLQQADSIGINVFAGVYTTIRSRDPSTQREITRYARKQIKWDNDGKEIPLPNENDGIIKYPISVDNKDTGLKFDVTYRYQSNGEYVYTFSLENSHVSNGTTVKSDDCFFQVKFILLSEKGFCPLTEGQKIMKEDEDYRSNQLLYRHVKNYAIGHGCAADWNEKPEGVFRVETAIFPQYEIKPIVPSKIEGVTLEMYKMSDLGNIEATISELNIMCEKYRDWINNLKRKAMTFDEPHSSTAIVHIANCEDCLGRMIEGVKILRDPKVQKAFGYMNRVMLLQQLHYNLPLQKWVDDENGYIKLENPIEKLPVINDPSTWYGDKDRYGKWRPFQLAFILINLKSMFDPTFSERKIVDLIWFPTGGGKTEAYLGLSAFTIFIRRLKNTDDSGTAILMRYTLRLLTAQQYERASSMICACETIRKEREAELGKSRISIGLWVGGETTPNHQNIGSNEHPSAIKAYDKLKAGSSDEYPFVIMKCPWCGAQIGAVPTNHGKTVEVPGLLKRPKARQQFEIAFRCSNSTFGCTFSSDLLPLYVIDDDIYEKTPTLILGTVDKFAMLPYTPEAQSIFGFDNGKKVSSPDLIIQDELHLISGPLGSMVGHYETMINELCAMETATGIYYPKIIASTATISRAKEQCHALYNCGRINVKQFPPSGIDAGDSFFAEIDKSQNGRRYCGILAAGSSSVATTMIRLYASLLYAGSALEVDNEEDRDPYWTHMGYFNSIRELGQVSTWIRADIDEYLHVIYKRRYEDKIPGYREHRRYIRRDEELTSRIRSDRVTASLSNLNISYPPKKDETGKPKDIPIDICLATNMISVGLDVPRLGLMTVAGQPKTTSEYIQATSRVGRSSKNAPGIVFTVYNPGRPRDKSHYEHFRSYHSRIYCNVEPTSVTPFSAPLRTRALHAIIIGIIRLEADRNFNTDPPKYPSQATINKIKNIIKKRVESIDPEETQYCLNCANDIFADWEIWKPQIQKYHDYNGGDILPLMFPAGTLRNAIWQDRAFATPTSMRSVDASCEAEVMQHHYFEEE